ncbi:hypothetical protein HQ533_04000 [Candidatus Woesearchaeota archaeon]|nr:hypothetical protein [Candidatus Woesearchaeota archaeon]
MGATDESEKQSLDSIILEPGIKCIGESSFKTFPNYRDEIEQFLKERKNRTKKELPFVNQEQTFIKLARALSSAYPYVVLIGEQGIGKSMVLDYTVRALTGEIKLSEVKKLVPEAAPLLKQMKDKARQFENRNYLLMPNLKEPMKVKAIPYTKPDDINHDFELAEDFCLEISQLLTYYITNNKESVKVNLSERQLRKLVLSKVHEMYMELYADILLTLSNKIKEKPTIKESLDNMISVVKLKPPQNLNQDVPKAEWKFYVKRGKNSNFLEYTTEAGFTAQRAQLSIEDIEQGLEKTYVHVSISNSWKGFLAEMKRIKVLGKPANFCETVVKEEFEKYNTEILEKAIQRQKRKPKPTQIDFDLDLIRRVNEYDPAKKISKETINDIMSEIKTVVDEFTKPAKNDELKNQMLSVYEFFNTEKNLLKIVMGTMLREIENMEKTPPGKLIKQPSFDLPHGVSYLAIDDIMSVNLLADYAAPTKRISWSKIVDTDPQTLFCSYNELQLPPHMAIASLGELFKSSILLFTDSFSDFISTITSNREMSKGMREQFLDYLQTGIITFVNEGVTYQFEAPRIILGCDNEDPFMTYRAGTGEKRDETGLRGRITALPVSEVIENTLEARKGTLTVLYDTIDKFNNERGVDITLDINAANMLLREMVPKESLILLKYRDLWKLTEDVCAYAVSKNTTNITANLLKQRTKDYLPPGFFRFVEFETEHGGYFDMPAKAVGHVNGLTVRDSSPGSVLKNRSQFLAVMDKTKTNVKHFELVDATSEKTDDNTIKSYELAVDYIRGLLSDKKLKLFEGGDWQLKTHFGGFWDKIGGPSTSMGMAISILSAFSGEEMYKNRFITGTIDPINGNAGIIGGTYHKSLIPMRLKELSPDNEKMYFLFPAANMKEFTKDVIFDPFEVQKNITCLPYENFEQAYYLLSCGANISKKNWEDSKNQGKTRLEKTLKEVNKRFGVK